MSNYSQPSVNPSKRSFSSPSPLSPVMEGWSEASTIRGREDSPTRGDSPTIPSFRVYEAEEGAGAVHDREHDDDDNGETDADDAEHDGGQDTLAPGGLGEEGRKGIRWSVIPKTPRSRVAVREESEEVLKRMHSLVGGGDRDEHEYEDDERREGEGDEETEDDEDGGEKGRHHRI
ncbi:hypothetical protein M422DRAFT_51298 [Sphaerobolus stellatus SS14]|uniref:Uncharacterized protein n=1 Tax=Sphaerobolus stellatus (strain SS14) TaxID=990650 RepID=A0A0C9U3P9_SPHS4|nr:hypothetical protein M422DRAFT_54461 [Sphaerobolus stellatus SS14]KIJ35823.1 hypothetical protein M422DRAFT_51298 [Sphaerobolus stellatus SS14]